MSGERALAVRVRLHTGRYHGAGDWPPSPSRVFQALVAAAGPATEFPEPVDRALAWLESLPPPTIAAPRAVQGQEVSVFVPNNDLDAAEGDPARISEIRTRKAVRPRLIDGDPVVTYLWPLDDDDGEQVGALLRLLGGLYQLGRGVDAASAEGRTGDRAALEAVEVALGRTLHRPGFAAGPGVDLDAPLKLLCPCPGSLQSLRARYRAESERLAVAGTGRAARLRFMQAPRPRFVEVAYGPARVRAAFDLRSVGTADAFAPWPLARVSELVVAARDAAARRLAEALPLGAGAIERHLVGRGEGVRVNERVRVVPLPSIGHEHVDMRVRRLLVDVPASCPILAEDVLWAFSGLELPGTGTVLVPADGTDMLRHYGIGAREARRWRTVTPVALPREGVGGPHEAARHLVQAVRHAGLGAGVEAVVARREPFDRHGSLAGAFAPGTRFDANALWHVEITFRRSLPGPVVLGDGRFLGLGVCRPVEERRGVLALRVLDGLRGEPDGEGLARALRRAALARFQEVVGDPPAWLHGHAESPHVAFAWDAPRKRLLVFDRPGAAGSRFADLRRALADLEVLRAGAAGSLLVEPVAVDPDADPLLAPAVAWRSVTPYAVERHRSRGDAVVAVREDIEAALDREGLRAESVEVEARWSTPGRGLRARVRLRFAVAAEGPLLLGRTRLLGGGLFEGVPRRADRPF